MADNGDRLDYTDSPEFVPEWDVLRDENGDPITLTWPQVRAVWHSIHVVDAVRRKEGARSFDENWRADTGKSRLLGRMLVHGLPPTRTKPPIEMGGPAWWLLEGGDPFVSKEHVRQENERLRAENQRLVDALNEAVKKKES